MAKKINKCHGISLSAEDSKISQLILTKRKLQHSVKALKYMQRACTQSLFHLTVVHIINNIIRCLFTVSLFNKICTNY